MALELTEEMNQMAIQDESVESGGETLDDDEMQNNPFPPEILSKVLSYLPQEEMVRNRSVCRIWGENIDTHCTMKVYFEEEEAARILDRKLQLRIRDCVINWMPADPNSILFANPQTMKTINFRLSNRISENNNTETIGRLLHQVKPYIHSLVLRCEEIEENTVHFLFSEPFEFPLLRDLWFVNEQYAHTLHTSVYLDCILFSHRMPQLHTLHLNVRPNEMDIMDATYKALFHFLATHRLTLKRLHVEIEWESMDEQTDLNQLPDMDQILPKSVETLLHNGTLQLQHLELLFSLRYSSVWIPILQRQRNLIHLEVLVEPEHFSNYDGIPFHVLLPAIEFSCATLRTISLTHILSVSSDGSTWIPLDCTAFKDVVNLTELCLSVQKDAIPKPDVNEAAPIINITQIPCACLKKLQIWSFVCDSGDLQTLVDNASLLEELELIHTLAPDNNPRYNSTGVHGGVIYSFVPKPNKKYIFAYPINFSNQEQNEKLDALRVLYPSPVDNFQSFCADFSN